MLQRIYGTVFSTKDALKTHLHNLEEAKKSLNNTVPLFANTGVKLETLESILNVADGCVVGTSLKHDGITWNQIDGERVKKFMDKVNEIRGS